MLRLVLSLISSMQVGARIKETVRQSVRRTVLAAIAIVVLLFAIGFGLAAGYHALIGQGLEPLAAAGIVAGTLALLGIVLLTLALRKPRPKQPDFVNEPAESIAMIDQSVGKAMQQAGPLTLLVAAFAAGLLMSRRR